MTTTTFGYSATQDRIWMRAHEVDVTVWLTRRMVLSVLGPMLTAFEVSTPGEQGGAAPKARAAIEHHLALHEAAPGQSPPQIRAGREVHAPVNDAMDGLCLRISSRLNGQGVVLQFETNAAPLEAGRSGLPGFAFAPDVARFNPLQTIEDAGRCG